MVIAGTIERFNDFLFDGKVAGRPLLKVSLHVEWLRESFITLIV